MNADPYAWYREALTGKRQNITEDAPQPGFYRRRFSRDGKWVPAAIWVENGELRCRVGPHMVNPIEHWPYMAKNPWPQDEVMAAFATGIWPSDGAPEAVTIGHNGAPPDLLSELQIEMENAAEWLEKNTAVTNQRDCTIAGNMAGAIVSLKQKAKAEHAAEKAPLAEQVKAVDTKWLPKIDAAEILAKKLKTIAGKWMEAEEARLKKEAAERAKREPEAAAATPIKLKPIGGARGKAIALRTFRKARIEDYNQVLQHFANHAKVKEVVQKLADAAVKAGVEVPGTKVIEERTAM